MKVSKILVSQPKPTTEKSPYFDIAGKHKVQIDFHSFIKVEGLTAKEFRQQKVSIPGHTAIVFLSRHAIDYFFTLCKDLRVTIPDDMKYFCLSETISLYIQKYVQYRKRKVFFGNGHIKDLEPLFVKHKNERYFVPTANTQNEELISMFETHGIAHSHAEMYRTVSNDLAAEYINEYDMFIFFSPHGIESLYKNAPDFVQGDKYIACFGKVTADAIRNTELRLDLEAPTAEATSMPAALDQFLTKLKG
ncbi:MAG: uroporphyrinogen-III synthase [Bacteroidaceae bacterium]|nr:uroporphyrinogen-III synthase [Bacteroidaceae bacterium]MBQ4039382.1 uroporphyrinogen-III synthase [Bacteroidaceae bacterium]